MFQENVTPPRRTAAFGARSLQMPHNSIWRMTRRFRSSCLKGVEADNTG